MLDELDFISGMALVEETGQEGTPAEQLVPTVQLVEMAPDGPEDLAHGGPGEEVPEEIELPRIAQGGLPEAAPSKPEELMRLKKRNEGGGRTAFDP